MRTEKNGANLTSQKNSPNDGFGLPNRSKTNSHVGKTYKPEARVVLFGNPNDTDIRESINRLKLQGREVGTQLRPGFDTGTGECGNHLCHCQGNCKAQYQGQE